MPDSWLFSLFFITVSTVVLTSGIFTLQNNFKAPSNRIFFALTISIAIWSAGMAISTVAPDAATCELWRRVSAVGWGTIYALLLHFTLVITDDLASFKKKWFIFCLYLPALITVFAFAVPNPLNPVPYQLYQTEYGWLNIAQHNIWDWIFYLYYISYTLTSLVLLIQWGKAATDDRVKKRARTIYVSIIFALMLGTFTDVIASSIFSELPQMAPAIMLIPTLAIYHTLQKESFGIIDPVEKKTSYVSIVVSVILYISISALHILLSNDGVTIGTVVFDESAARGVIVQIQMFISIYLVLKENRPGYIVSVLMNSIILVMSLVFLIRSGSTEALPGVVSYTGVIVLITLIKAYKDKIAAYIKRINDQIIKERFFSSIFKQAPVGIAILNDKNHTRSTGFEDININPTYENILGRSKDELQNISWPEITHPDDLAKDLALFNQFKQGEIDYYSLEKRYIKPDKSVVWVDMLVAPFSTSDGKSDDHLCIISDITKRKDIESTLKYNSEHVMLTGLYNRDVLEKKLKEDAKMSLAEKRALLSINLSSMDILSLRYGFHYSQKLLREIADALKTLHDGRYELFQTYENRFVYYVKGYQDRNELTGFCRTIAQTLDSYLYIHGINSSIGALEIDETFMGDAELLLTKLLLTSEMAGQIDHQDAAILFYGPEVDRQVARENAISHELTEIASGLKTERIYMQHQPVFDLATNSICGFESLARFNSAKYGLVPPAEFISLAEKTNLIIPLGNLLIENALQFLVKLKEHGHDSLTLSINISMIQLLKEGFADKLLGRIKVMQLNPEYIGIELTETAFAVEQTQIQTVLDQLKASGINILIDDFGTGYSSFSRQRELNVDVLKIDKSFIDNLLLLDQDVAITGDIISMAHKLGRGVIAEGVEDERQLRYLREHHCDKIQGFLISKPLDEGAALEFLKSGHKWSEEDAQ